MRLIVNAGGVAARRVEVVVAGRVASFMLRAVFFS